MPTQFLISLIQDSKGQPVVSSLEVAHHFQKKHNNILRDIERIRSQVPKIFFELNFGLIEQEVVVGYGVRKDRSYLLTRDAFSLIAMGFTGSAAIRWKIQYIEAFNAMEQTVLAQKEQLLELARESGYQQGLSAARALPAAEADRKSAYLDGMKEGVRVQKRQDRLLRLEKILVYRDKGLTWTEIARLTGCSREAMRCALHKGRALFAKAMAVTA